MVRSFSICRVGGMEEPPELWISTLSLPSQEPPDIPELSVPHQRIALLREEEMKGRQHLPFQVSVRMSVSKIALMRHLPGSPRSVAPPRPHKPTWGHPEVSELIWSHQPRAWPPLPAVKTHREGLCRERIPKHSIQAKKKRS